VTVQLGVAIPFSERTQSVVEAAPAVEERGIESLWVGEHTHLPVATTHSYTRGRYAGKTAREGYVPDMYKRFVDPFVTLSAAAAVTRTLRLGSAICLVAEHNPIILAKQVSTLDLVSGGRFELGVGFGWNPIEMLNNHCDPSRRRETARAKVRAMQALWTQETASADGELVSFTESWSFPKPVQTPYPPILVGSGPAERNFAEIVDWADGWLPVNAMSGPDLASDVARLRARADDAGRDPASMRVTVIEPTASFVGKRSHDDFVAALPSQDVFQRWCEIGVERVVIRCPADETDRLFRALDFVAGLRALIP
jgi:probable F420-dependent oxidoreductase